MTDAFAFIGRVLIAVYGILALAALGRSTYQIAIKFDAAPVAYSLSALAAAIVAPRRAFRHPQRFARAI